MNKCVALQDPIWTYKYYLTDQIESRNAHIYTVNSDVPRYEDLFAVCYIHSSRPETREIELKKNRITCP